MLSLQCFDAVGWVAGRAWPVKNWVVGCWHGCLSGVRCRLAYVPADATATHCLASVKSRLVLPFWYRLTWVVLEKGPLNGCVCVLYLLECFCAENVSYHIFFWENCNMWKLVVFQHWRAHYASSCIYTTDWEKSPAKTKLTFENDVN